MAANPALWSDVARDLDAALRQSGKAAALHALSEAGPGAAEPLALEGWHLAVGKCLDAAYSAVESAIERLIVEVDGHRPSGASFHAELLRRAASAVEGVRGPLIGAEVARDLDELRRFRHAYRRIYDDLDYARVVPNVAVAARGVPAAARTIEAFCRAFGIVAAGSAARFGDGG